MISVKLKTILDLNAVPLCVFAFEFSCVAFFLKSIQFIGFRNSCCSGCCYSL